MRSREQLAMETWEEQIALLRREVEEGTVPLEQAAGRRAELDTIAAAAAENRLTDVLPLHKRPYPYLTISFILVFADKLLGRRRR